MKQILALPVLVATAFAAELPVRDVVLYKHGVGYFERSGELKAGETARLDFKASEMDDVLKSLTIESKGGRVAGVRYDSSEPLERKLAEFPFQLNGEPALSAFLAQMKGARLELVLGSGTVAGTIVTARLSPGDDRRSEREQVVLLLDSGELRTFDLSAATSVRFTDIVLQGKLRDYLGLIASARTQDRRNVFIDSGDAAARTVTASYLIPVPVWKSSYRLIFGATGEPTLEGWAIVDNTTGEDWNQVRFALVSGRPISFISPLYEPRFRQREVAELPDDASARPVVHAGGVVGGVPGGVTGGVMGGIASIAPPSPPPAAYAAPAPRMKSGRAEALGRATAADAVMEAAPMTAPSDILAAAEGREVGELFEYRFGTPVTVKKNESAMLPFVQQKVGARKLLIYSGRGSEHPTNAAELTNSTGKTLDGGPITVYDGGSYAGEALVETLKSADKRLISYAVDLGTRISTTINSGADVVQSLRVNRGILIRRSAIEETTTYTVRNVDEKAKTLLVERPIRRDYQVLSPKPVELTATAMRFEIKLGPKSTESFVVREERVFDSSYAVMNLTPDVLLGYLQVKSLSAAARQQLQVVADAKRRIAAADRELQQIDGQINETVRDQERIRQNLGSLNAVAGQQDQVQRYARELAAQETRLASLRDQQAQLRKQRSALESEVNAAIEKMDF